MTDKIALLSDIHGNLFALDAVLAQLQDEGIERIVCLGDVALFGPQPREVLARVRELGCPVVLGNTDAWALDPAPRPKRNEDSKRFYAIEGWGAAQLRESDLAFIRTFFPVFEETFAGETSLCCYHGSPRSYNDPIRSTTPVEELAPMLDGRHATVLAGGHTHEQMVRRHGEMLIVNPGSVGQPYEVTTDGVRNPPWAEFAILSVGKGHIGIELRRVAYDITPLIAAVLGSDMPYADWWAAEWR